MYDYPTDKDLKYIQDFVWKNNNLPELIEFLESIWWMPDWGFHLNRKYKGYQTLYISTGGWSGNESIISEMESNFYIRYFWVQSRRGGHYIYKFKIK